METSHKAALQKGPFNFRTLATSTNFFWGGDDVFWGGGGQLPTLGFVQSKQSSTYDFNYHQTFPGPFPQHKLTHSPEEFQRPLSPFQRQPTRGDKAGTVHHAFPPTPAIQHFKKPGLKSWDPLLYTFTPQPRRSGANRGGDVVWLN